MISYLKHGCFILFKICKEAYVMEILILILFILNIAHCLTSVNIVSDLVEPIQYCLVKYECEETGIDGDVDCINKYCSCVNHTKYKKHIKGCYKNVGFGDVCNITAECVTPGSFCNYTNCEKDSYKRCVCNDDAELISGSCQLIRDTVAKKCCTNKDCNIENMNCNTNRQKCECKRNFYFINDSCISHTDINICQKDDDCTHIANSKCTKINNTSISKCQCIPNFYFLNNSCISHTDINICQKDDDCTHIANSKCTKINNTSISKCQCTPNFYFHNNSCISLNICSNSKQCRNNENCYLSPNSEYGICYEDLICKNKEILIDNQLTSIKEKLCKSNTNCNNTEMCCPILTNNTGICIQVSKCNLINSEKSGVQCRCLNLSASKKTNKIDVSKEEVLKYDKNRAENIKDNQTILFFIYLSGILFAIA